MRVRVVKPTTAYWNYQVHQWAKDEELSGEVARHLADNAPPGSIKVIEDDREDAARSKAAADKQAARIIPDPHPGNEGTGSPGGQTPATGPGAAGGAGGGQTPGPDNPGNGGDHDEPPVDGTIDDLMKWIDGDPERSARALAAEQAKDKPRSTVVKRLAPADE